MMSVTSYAKCHFMVYVFVSLCVSCSQLVIMMEPFSNHISFIQHSICVINKSYNYDFVIKCEFHWLTHIRIDFFLLTLAVQSVYHRSSQQPVQLIRWRWPHSYQMPILMTVKLNRVLLK